MGLLGLLIMLQSAYFTHEPTYSGNQFVIGGWYTHFPNCLQCRELFLWYHVKWWIARLYRKLLPSNCATNKETTDKQEAPKNICKYLAAQKSFVNLNVSKLLETFRLEYCFFQFSKTKTQQKSYCCMIPKIIPVLICRYCICACVIHATGK